MEVKKQLRNSIVLPPKRYALETRARNKSNQSRNGAMERSYMWGAFGLMRWNEESQTTEKTPSLTSHAQLLGNLDSSGTLSLVQLGDNSVSWMGNNSTEDTSNVTCSKGHHQLLRLGTLVSGLRHHVLVECLHGALKTGKLHHCVGDLTAPQWHNTLVESPKTFLLVDDGGSSSQGWRKARLGLNTYLWKWNETSLPYIITYYIYDCQYMNQRLSSYSTCQFNI